MASKQRDRAEWQELIGQWKSSGESAKDFAARHGVHASTLYWWSHRLGSESRADKPTNFLAVEVTLRTGTRN